MIKRLCIFPSCRELAVNGHKLCEKHLKESEERRKEYCFQTGKRSNEGMYNTTRWRNLRKKIIKQQPFCSFCGWTGSEDNPLTVDHVICPRGNEDLFYDETNLQVLCRNCHNRKTAEEIRERKKN